MKYITLTVSTLEHIPRVKENIKIYIFLCVLGGADKEEMINKVCYVVILIMHKGILIPLIVYLYNTKNFNFNVK